MISFQRLVVPCLGAAALALLPVAARAHAIESSLDQLRSLNDTLLLESRFSSGEPAAGAQVRVVPPGGGTPVAVGQLDADGKLSFVLPSGADGTWELQVDDGPGHRDFLDLTVKSGRPLIDSLSRRPAEPTAPWTSPWLIGTLVLGGLGSIGGVIAGLSGWSAARRRLR